MKRRTSRSRGRDWFAPAIILLLAQTSLGCHQPTDLRVRMRAHAVCTSLRGGARARRAAAAPRRRRRRRAWGGVASADVRRCDSLLRHRPRSVTVSYPTMAETSRGGAPCFDVGLKVRGGGGGLPRRDWPDCGERASLAGRQRWTRCDSKRPSWARWRLSSEFARACPRAWLRCAFGDSWRRCRGAADASEVPVCKVMWPAPWRGCCLHGRGRP